MSRRGRNMEQARIRALEDRVAQLTKDVDTGLETSEKALEMFQEAEQRVRELVPQAEAAETLLYELRAHTACERRDTALGAVYVCRDCETHSEGEHPGDCPIGAAILAAENAGVTTWSPTSAKTDPNAG